jgi:hypothetical protein
MPIAPGGFGDVPRAGPSGFDFRLVRLDPSHRGSRKLCDVAGFERTGSSRGLVSCWMGTLSVPLELEHTQAQSAMVDRIRRGQRLLVEIVEPGADRGGPEARVRLFRLAGQAPPIAAPAPTAASDASGFDFNRVNRERALHRTAQTCLVHSFDRVARIDPAAPRGHPTSWFPPGAAEYWLRITCRHASGTSRLIVGALEYQPLLAVQRDRAIQVRVWHQERFPQREAIGVIMGADGG